jgi:hypothetical protein
MDKAFTLKPGDKVIYKVGYTVQEATVVEKPVDDNYVRPRFAIGRYDLDNGDYLIVGATIYDSVDECMKVIKDGIKKEIEDTEKMIKYYNSNLTLLKKRLESM